MSAPTTSTLTPDTSAVSAAGPVSVALPGGGLFAGRRVTAVLLVLAPIAEIVEATLSPLRDGTTTEDLGRIAAHQQAFAVSVVIGLIGTLLYLPGFLGLMELCRSRTPRWARLSGWLVLLSISCFVGVRATQATELSLARSGLPVPQAAGILDAGWGSPIGMIVFLLFLGGAFVGLVAMGVTVWRAGFPRPAAVLLALFQPIDLLAGGHWGTVVSHTVLLVALGWLALHAWRGTTRARA